MEYRGRTRGQSSVEEGAQFSQNDQEYAVDIVTGSHKSHRSPPERLPQTPRKRGVFDTFKLVGKSDFCRNNRHQFSPNPAMGLQPVPRQVSGRGCCDSCDTRKPRQESRKHRPQMAPRNSSITYYDAPPPPKPRRKVSCESCGAPPAKPRPQPSCESCCAPPPNSRRESGRQSRGQSCSVPCAPPKPRCEYCLQVLPKPRSDSRSKARRDSYRETEPQMQAECSCNSPPLANPRTNGSPCCRTCNSVKSRQQGYAASKCNSDYIEYKEFKQPICRNPLVIKSRCMIRSASNTNVPTACPAYKDNTSRTRISCECGTSSRAKGKSSSLPPPPRETREYCMNSSPSDYMEDKRNSGLFTRNPLTVSSCSVKINPCPKQPKPPIYSNETLNERKVECQSYCCPTRQTPAAPDPPRKSQRSTKPKSRPKKAPSRRSLGIPQLQQRSSQVDRTCYVPPSCFAPTSCPAKKKRPTEARRGRSSSGFNIKPVTSISRSRRRIKAHVSNRHVGPAFNAQNINEGRQIKERSSKIVGPLNPKARDRCSKTLMGSGYNMIPLPTLTRLNMHRRIPKLNPCTVHTRCRGGKLTPATTRVIKSRHRDNQRVNSINSLATARTTPRRNSETRRDRSHQTQASTPSHGGTRSSQSTARRDLPQRYQAPSSSRTRPVQVTEEVSHSVPKRTQSAGPTPQMARQQNTAQATSRPVSNRVSEVERPPVQTPSRGQTDRRSMSIRAQNAAAKPPVHPEEDYSPQRAQDAGRSSSQSPSQGHTRTAQNILQEAGRHPAHSFPHRVQEAERAPIQADEQYEEIRDRPQFSRSDVDQPKAVNEHGNHQFYRGSFLSIRPKMPNEPAVQNSPRSHGSLIMIAPNGVQQQILKRSVTKGSSFIVPNKWMCMSKMNGFAGVNPIVEMGPSMLPHYRHSWSWRKYCPNWLLNGKPRTFGA